MEKIELNRIYNEDCLEGMKRIPDNSVDLIVTDPPYKLTSGGQKNTSIDFVFNRGNVGDNFTGKFFNVPKFSDWLPECFRVLKEGTHCYCMSNDRNLKEMIIESERAGFKLLNILVWDKGMHSPTMYYMKNVEFILLLRKGRARKINNLGDFALIKVKGVYGNKVHVSEKPSALFEKFILNSSNEQNVILDPFMGSGTTAISCINTNRNYIGFEIDKEYCKISEKRILEHKPKLL